MKRKTKRKAYHSLYANIFDFSLFIFSSPFFLVINYLFGLFLPIACLIRCEEWSFLEHTMYGLLKTFLIYIFIYIYIYVCVCVCVCVCVLVFLWESSLCKKCYVMGRKRQISLSNTDFLSIIIDWLYLTVCQSFLVDSMPRGYRITYI